MMVSRDDIIAEARSWVGTRFQWNQSLKGVACDCKGLVWGVARELGMPEAQSPYASEIASRRIVRADRLREGLASVFCQTNDPLPGDVMHIRVGAGTARMAMHLAFLSHDNMMIHCYDRGPGGVREIIMDENVIVESYWAWPSLGECRG